MRTYILLLIIGTGCILQQCKKPEGDDLSGELEVNGRVVLTDTLKGIAEEIVLSGHNVEIKTAPFADAFLFQVRTDSNGAFTVTNLSAKTYYLYAEKKIGEVLFTDTVQVDPQTVNDVTLDLLPVASDYNILSLIARDASANPVNLLNNVSICLFKTWPLAQEGKCEAAVWTGTTDKNGRAQTTGLAACRYYISATFTSGNIRLVKNDSVQVTATGITQKELFLSSGTAIWSLTGEVLINDTLWGLNEEIPLASQAILVKKEAERDHQSYLQQVTSNERGVFVIGSLAPGAYSLQASKTINGVLFTDTVAVQSPVYTKMVLYPSATNYNILQVTVRDYTTGGLLNNVTVCIFNSRQIAENNDCEGALVTDHSNAYGKFVTTRLMPSRYYINAHLAVGNTTLTVKDSVDITSAAGLSQKNIWLK
jgi:hypothetical protein